MTIQEANNNLKQIESEIRIEYSQLLDAAHKEGEDAEYAISKKTMVSTLSPLLISVFGILLTYMSRGMYGFNNLVANAAGFGLIILGIYIAVKAHRSAKSTEMTVQNMRGELESVLNSHSNL